MQRLDEHAQGGNVTSERSHLVGVPLSEQEAFARFADQERQRTAADASGLGDGAVANELLLAKRVRRHWVSAHSGSVSALPLCEVTQ